jgi:uncharacterized protein YgiM (DUF1202 family)
MESADMIIQKILSKSLQSLLFSAFLGLAMMAGQSLAAESGTMYVQSKKAKLHEAPSFKATVITTLPQGTEVKVLQKDKRWYRVAGQNKSGWVSRLVLADHPPGKKITVLDSQDANTDEQQQKARRRASSNNSAAATRGLRDSGRTRMSQEDQPDYQALDTVKSQTVSEEAATEFLEQGTGQ